MADWERLREIGRDGAPPPPFEALVAEAGRRERRARVVAVVATFAVAAALGFGVTRINDDEDANFQPVKDPSPSISNPSEDLALPDGVLALPESSRGEQVALAAGRYRIELTDSLSFDVDVPDDTAAHSDGTFLATRHFILKTEVAGEEYGVPRDPCTNQEIDPVGPSVTDLVHAITDLPGYRTTRPRSSELGGAVGSYVEARIPRTYDASQCSGGAVALPANPETAVSGPPPYLGRWWILEVDGQRVVVQQNCWGCTTAQLDRGDPMTSGITFTPTS